MIKILRPYTAVLLGLITSITGMNPLSPLNQTARASVTSEIVAGDGFSCALFGSGEVECWGSNWHGELGNGGEGKFINSSNLVPGLSNVSSLAAGNVSACALIIGGIVKCWGDNDYGQLGDGSNVQRDKPTAVLDLPETVAISGAGVSMCALTVYTTVWCWGYNHEGQLGDGSSRFSSNSPTEVKDLTGVKEIAVLPFTACALLEDKTVWCWGVIGQAPNGPVISRTPTRIIGLPDAVSISSKKSIMCASLSEGGDKCWGWAPKVGWVGGVLDPIEIPLLTNVLVVAKYAWNESGCNLMTDSTLFCWRDSWNVAVYPWERPNLSGVSAIAAGKDHYCAMLVDETVKCWGANSNGQLGDGSTKNSYGTPVSVLRLLNFANSSNPEIIGETTVGKTVTAQTGLWDGGASFTYKWMRDGVAIDGATSPTYELQPMDGNTNVTVQVTGTKVGYRPKTLVSPSKLVDFAPLPISINKYSSLSTGYDHSCGLTTIGIVRCWGNDTYTPTRSERYVAVSAGGRYTCAIKQTSMELDCWANSDLAYVNSAPIGLGPVKQVSAGFYHACAITASDEAVCWGYEQYGRTRVPSNLGKVKQISAGDILTCAITFAEKVRCWGYWADTTPIDQEGVKQVTVGDDHACGVTSDNLVLCWGHSTYGELEVPADLSLVTKIDAGGGYTCALQENGLVRCWGYNYGNNLDPLLQPKTLQISVGAEHACALSSGGLITCWGRQNHGRTTPPSPILIPNIPDVSLDYQSRTELTLGINRQMTQNDGNLVWNVSTEGTQLCSISTAGQCQVGSLVVGKNYTFSIVGVNEAGETQKVDKSVKFCPLQDAGILVEDNYLVRTMQKVKIQGEVKVANLCSVPPKTLEYRKKEFGKNWTSWKPIPIKVSGKWELTDIYQFNSQIQFKTKISTTSYTTGFIPVNVVSSYALPLSFYTKATKIQSGYTQGGEITIKFNGDKKFNGTCTVLSTIDSAYNFALVEVGSEKRYSTFKVKNGFGSGMVKMRWNGKVNVSALCQDPKFQDVFDFRLPIFKANF